MDIFCTEEHDLIRQTVRDFAEELIRPVARELDEKEEFSVSLTRKMGEIGLFGMVVDEKYNGEGFDTLSYIIAVEELARVDSSQAATVAAHNSLGIGPIYHYGTEKQKKKYLPRLTTGEYLWGFGLTEPNAGSDSRATQTTAKPEGKEWVINGSKIFITNAATSITLGTTVQVRTSYRSGRKNLSALIVDQNTPGFKTEEMKGKMMWRSSNTAQLFFDNCRVPRENLLGKVGMGSRIMLSTLDSGRLSIAAMGLGLSQGAFEMALNYANQRKQFGRFITKFQGVSFKLAEMATKIEAARNMLYKACWLKDKKRPFAKEAAMSKLFCTEVAKEVADHAVQIHGGYGLMKDYDIERFYRDQRLLQIGEGTSEIQKLVISNYLGLS